MASRAFFRCRACGEPVVAGAYRCPNCAIDFPTGTPGAPTAPDSPAAVERARPDPRHGRPEREAAAVPGQVAPGQVGAEIAARLDQALVGEVVPPESEPPAPPAPPVPARAEPQPAPARTEVQPGRAGPPSVPARTEPVPPGDDSLAEIVPAAAEPSERVGLLDAVPGARRDTVPGSRIGAERVQETGLSLAPGKERPREKARPAREPSRELVPVGRRRNKARSLVTTTVLALVVLAGVGAAGYLVDGARIMNIGAGGSAEAEPLRVEAADGWVAVPPAGATMVITADGPYRLRLDGVVYHMTGEKTVRVPMTDATSLAIRAVGAPTVAEVARAAGP